MPKKKKVQTPAFVTEAGRPVIRSEISVDTIDDWAYGERITTVLDSWKAQQTQERNLRKLYANWIFGLISVQILPIVVLLFLDSSGVVKLNAELMKIILPAVLAEVLGMGWVVVKYLFNKNVKDELLSFVFQERRGPDNANRSP